METKTIASTPIRPAKKSRIMEMSRPTTTGAVPAAQIQFAGSARPKAHVSRPRTSPPRATTIRARRYNGDIGYIDDVDPNAGEVVASFDGRSVTYGFGELDMLVPAYAATIHKSQGSEYPAVVIPVMTQHYAMLQRNLLHRRHTRQAAGRVGRAEEGRRWYFGRGLLGSWPQADTGVVLGRCRFAVMTQPSKG